MFDVCGSALKARRRAGSRRAEQQEQVPRASPGTFADMSPGGDEDLDWLYGRDRQQAEPERTRVMPSPSGPAAPYSSRVVPDPPPTRTAQPRPTRRQDHPAVLLDPAGPRRLSFLGDQGNGIRFGSSSVCC